jgi:hypothetical protein
MPLWEIIVLVFWKKSIYIGRPIGAYRSLCRRDIMAEKKTRNFALRDKDGNEIGVFTGKQPRQAALKAANRGHIDIKLRERGTKKVHLFTGERKQVKKPKGAPTWMPDKIWKPIVKKVGTEKWQGNELMLKSPPIKESEQLLLAQLS